MEKEEKEMRIAEKQANRAENMLNKKALSSMGEAERTWFQTPRERQQEKCKLEEDDGNTHLDWQKLPWCVLKHLALLSLYFVNIFL